MIMIYRLTILSTCRLVQLLGDAGPVVSGAQHPVADDQGGEAGVCVVIVIIALEPHS